MSAKSPLRSVLTICAVLALVVGAVIFLPPILGVYLDKSAAQKANNFCELIALGESEDQLRQRAKIQSVALEEWATLDDGMRYVVWFNGFLMNAAVCNIVVRHGNVSAKYVEIHKW